MTTLLKDKIAILDDKVENLQPSDSFQTRVQVILSDLCDIVREMHEDHCVLDEELFRVSNELGQHLNE